LTSSGYAWWYIDALSDDRRHGLTIIAFVGSVFSPYYAAARRRGTANPENHVAMNVALYGPRAHRWAMTERGKASLRRSQKALAIGPSHVAWDSDTLHIGIREWAVPLPQRIEGEVEIRPESPSTGAHRLDVAGRHMWCPIAPLARASVRMRRPDLSWEGMAYIDSNIGAEPLADAFRDWNWSRSIESAQTRIFYDLERRDGTTHALAITYDRGGVAPTIQPPQQTRIGHSRWRLPLDIRSERSEAARKVEAWEDGPFYARSLVEHQLNGKRELSVHERLSLERFERPWVQAMLPFRMPRRTF
jgi:carotenoid 1,2-hydratase